MHSRWVRWIAYLVLASLVVVTSCRAWAGDAFDSAAVTLTVTTPAPVSAVERTGHIGAQG